MATCACGQTTRGVAAKCERCTALHVLELGSGATQAEIVEAYRTLVKVWHPDRFQSDETMRAKAGKRLADINAAYQYLLQNPSSGIPKSGARPQEQPRTTQTANNAQYSRYSQGPISSPVATRSMAFGKLIFVGALLLLVIAFIIAIGHTSSSGSNPTPTTETTNTTAGSNDTTSSSRTEETSDSKPSFSVTSGNTIYHGAISSNVGVAVISVSSQPFLMGIGNLIRPDGKFILVTLAISNRQHDAITMSDGLFEIADPYGNVYSASDKSMEVDNENNLFLAQINPGIIKVGEVIFDVPRDLSLTNLQLRFRGGMTGESAQVALMADTTVVPPPNPSLETEQTASSQEPPTSSVANSASGVTNQFGLQGSSAAPRSAADAVHHPGGSVLYPKLIHSAAPEYTEEARQAKLSGTVRLYLLVDKNGNPSHVQVVKGLGMGLDQSAISAVEQYRFEPATENGVPVTVDLYTDVKFQML